MSLKNSVISTLVLALASLAALLFSHLALHDIYYGEADQSLEWRVLQVASVIMVVFIAFTISTLIRVLKSVE